MSNLKEIEALQLLVQQGWLKLYDNRWSLEPDKGQFVPGTPVSGDSLRLWQSKQVAIAHQELMLPATEQEWELKFINLIADAQVPQKLEDNKGGVYYANKFSETGLKVFKTALKRGVIYEVLVKSVMLYYKSSVRYKKAIGNYFAQGDWRTDYEALLASAEAGGDALNKHIKEEISDGTTSQFKLG